MVFIRKNLGLLGFVLTVLIVRTTFANQYVVPTGSMIPTIAIGDRIFTDRTAYDLKVPLTDIVIRHMGEPTRGDVVVFNSPSEDMVLVKRLIGLPGDHLVIKNGFVSLNGQRIDDYDGGGELAYHETLGAHHYAIQRLPAMMRPDHFDFVVPANHYFMMGDNRDNSADSRVFGFVDRAHLIGRAERVLFSLDFPQVKAERTGMKLD